MKYGYSRVSTADQDASLQLIALSAFGVDKIFSDAICGGTNHRPELDKLREALTGGDHVVVWKLDRLFRSTIDALTQIEDWSRRGILFTCTSQNITTADDSPTGKLMRTILFGFAEFERDLIRERTKAGMAAAKAQGKHMGRRKSLGDAQITDAKAKIADGWTVSKVARFFKVSRGTLYNHGVAKSVLPKGQSGS